MLGGWQHAELVSRMHLGNEQQSMLVNSSTGVQARSAGMALGKALLSLVGHSHCCFQTTAVYSNLMWEPHLEPEVSQAGCAVLKSGFTLLGPVILKAGMRLKS